MQIEKPPKGAYGIIQLIEEIDSKGAYAIETDYRPEIIGKLSNLLDVFLRTYGDDFYDLLGISEFIKKLPKHVSYQKAEDESCFFQLGPPDGNQRHFVYEWNSKQMEAFLETSNANGQALGRIPLSEIDQSSFPILAAIIASPLISVSKQRKKNNNIIRWFNNRC